MWRKKWPLFLEIRGFLTLFGKKWKIPERRLRDFKYNRTKGSTGLDVLIKGFENNGKLCPCGRSSGRQDMMFFHFHTGDDPMADGPFHRNDRILRQAVRVLKTGDGPTGGAVISLVLCISVHDSHQLLTGDGLFRAERAFAVSGYDVVVGSPVYGIGEPASGGNIAESCGGSGSGLSVHGVQDLYDHSPGNDSVRSKRRIGKTR